jgi:hypothetical protein
MGFSNIASNALLEQPFHKDDPWAKFSNQFQSHIEKCYLTGWLKTASDILVQCCVGKHLLNELKMSKKFKQSFLTWDQKKKIPMPCWNRKLKGLVKHSIGKFYPMLHWTSPLDGGTFSVKDTGGNGDMDRPGKCMGPVC